MFMMGKFPLSTYFRSDTGMLSEVLHLYYPFREQVSFGDRTTGESKFRDILSDYGACRHRII